MEFKQYARQYYNLLKAHGNDMEASSQEKYMRNRFTFIGLKKPLRNSLHKAFESEHGALAKKESLAMAKACLEYPEREMSYTAIHYLDRYKSLLTYEDLPFLKEVIVRGDWWDVVDSIASNHLGALCQRDNRAKKEVQTWIFEDNFWLRRSAIIFQLKYKKTTDVDFLSLAIQQCANEKEFFIKKAIGWALREYSKTNPEFVRYFITSHRTEISSLSFREASKYVSVL